MLQKLRDQTQSLFFKILVGAIVFVLAIFGFGAFNLFLTADPEVASVNGEDITEQMVYVESEREKRRLAGRFGDNFDPSMIDPILLQNAVVDQLIRQTLLRQATDDLDLGVSQKKIDETLVSNPNFQIDGQFEPNTFRRTVSAMGYQPQEFSRLTGEFLAIDQLRSGIVDTAFSTDWELRRHAQLLSQRRDLAWLEFKPEAFADGVVVADEDVKLRYEENQLDFMTEENVDVAYVELTVDALQDNLADDVDEDELVAAYEAEKSAAALEEQRKSRHILLQVTEERPAEAAEQALLELKARIGAGEDFAELAREYSEDPGSAEAGGELGAVSKGNFDPEFERVLWQLEPGQLSDPVRTEFGYHLIQLEDIIVNEFPPFEEMRAELKRSLLRDRAQSLFVDRLRELDNLAFEQPDSVEGIANQLGLEVRTATGVSRTTGSGIFGNVSLRESVFTDEVLLEGYNSPATEYVEGRAVVARVTARHEPEVKPFEEVADEIRAQIVQEQAATELERAQAAALARIEAGESVAEVANDAGLEWQTVELARRNQPNVPQPVVQAAFELPRPGPDAKQVGEASGSNRERYVVTVTRVEDGDVSKMTEAEIAEARRFLASRSDAQDFGGFYAALKEAASISRSR